MTTHAEPRMSVIDGEVETELPVPVPSRRTAFEKGMEYRAIATLRIALTRDHLAAAADFSAQNDGYISPEMWSTEYTRHLVELSLAHESALVLDEGARCMADLMDEGNSPDVSLLPKIRAVYRAIDAAYPEQSPAVSVVDRDHRGAFVVCSRCDWELQCGDDERDVSAGIDHFEREHGQAVTA